MAFTAAEERAGSPHVTEKQQRGEAGSDHPEAPGEAAVLLDLAAASSADGTCSLLEVEFIGMDFVLVAGALNQCDRAGGPREMGLL